MTIRKRLILSYIAMVLIPLLLFVGIAFLLVGVFFEEKIVDSEFTDQSRYNGMPWETFEKRNQLVAGMKMMAKYAPEQLTESQYLEGMNEQFNELKTGIVIVKENEIIYTSPLVYNKNLYEQLVPTKEDEHIGWGTKMDARHTMEQYDFLFNDQSMGTIYFLSDMNPIFEKLGRFLPTLLISLLFVVGLTNGLLTFLVSRSIIKPLYQLKEAAEQIKDGNLEQSLTLHRKDEIGKVAEAFEEMRIRMKQSLHLQLQYEENRKELVSSISHDLKTPITGIKACIEGLQHGIADTEEKRKKYIYMINKKTTEMDRLIDELFLFSKLDLKRLPFHFEKIDIVSYMQEYYLELKAEPQLKEVSIHLEEDIGGTQYVMADWEKLQRAVMNIVTNSLRYSSRRDKEIHLKLTKAEQHITVRIQDNGPGIDREALPHIFERFYRVDASRNTHTGGSGLGLAIVKQIIDEHGGRTWAESAVGEGTMIFFTLPLVKEYEGE